ncbi:MAG: hypothetical protein DCC68_12350 [Planctomycetota bacterium]|nr:MAG: hypothetical protein DCC68_12350 [Planctomycetota bacterium]
MHDYLETIAAAATSNALVATALGIVAWLASRWANPTVAHALWLLVLVKLVTPPIFEASVPLPAALAFHDESAMVVHDSAVDPSASELGVSPTFPLEAKPSPANAPTPSDDVDLDDEVVDDEAVDVQSTLADDPLVDNAVPVYAPRPVGVSSDDHQAPIVWVEPAGVARPPATVPAVNWVAPPDAPDAAPSGLDLPQVEAPGGDAAEALSTSARISPPVAEVAKTSAVPATFSIDSAAFALSAVWITGSIAWFGLALARIVRFRRLLRRAVPATPPLQREVASLAERIGLARAPEVLVVAGQISPLVCTPLCRAVLVLPRDLLSRFSAEQRAAVIAHELAHLRRRDHWTRWLELVAVGCYWWLPTIWFARRQLHAAEEACCDAWVIWLLPDRSRDYARALLETIDFLAPAPETPLLASGFSRASHLKRRFDMILRHRASHRLSWPARVGIAAAAAAILPWSLTALSADEPPQSPSAKNADNPPAALAELPEADPSAAAVPSAGLPPTAPRKNGNAPSAGAALAPPRASNDAAPAVPRTPAPVGPPSAFAPPAVGSPPVPELPTAPRLPPIGVAPATGEPKAENLPATQSFTPTPPTNPTSSADASVAARLERLEATTAELLVLVKQLRAERGAAYDKSSLYDDPADPADPTDFVVRYGHGDRQLDIKVAGRQVSATDTATGKILWTTTMPWRVTAIQGANGQLMTNSRDGGQALIDPENGAVRATNTAAPSPKNPPTTEPQPPSVPSRYPAPYASPSHRPTVAADRAEEIAKVEMEMLASERKLAQQRADLQHEVRQMETRRARAARKLDSLTEEATSEDRAKLTAQLEEAEDQLAALQHKVESFEADLEFKVRELELRRDQLLRTFDPFAQPSRSKPSQPAAKLQAK